MASKIVLTLFLLAQLAGLSLLAPEELEAGELASVSDTLSNNRLSFRGELEGAVAAGSGVIILDTTPEDSNNTSTGSASLMQNENVRVGSGSTADVIAVKTIDTATRVTLASGLTTAASDGNPVIATVSAIHTVSFTPASTITNGAFRVLIPGSSTQSTTGDGLPDKDGFDLISDSLPTVSCSGGGSGFTFKTGTATVSATQVGGSGAWYHSFECRYYGDTAPSTSTAVTMTIGTPAGNKVLNPSPSGYSATHFPGQMDTYTFRTRHLYGTVQSYAQADETLGTIGVVEAVRVTATVAPTLTFHLSAVSSGTSFCGGPSEGTNVTTTVNTVPFDTISTTAFKNGAHQLVISTNADEGYSVTASESGALSIGGLGTTTIADTSCDASCTVTTAQEWSTETNKGFGYALQDGNGTPVTDVSNTLPYNYDGRTFNARPFGITAQQIMKSTEPVADDSAYVCYRVIVSGLQTAGDYQNYVIYIATATF